jgi:hypothetical protein
MTTTTLHLIPNYIGQGGGLSLAVPVFAHVASAPFEHNPYGGVEHTETGVRCGECSDFADAPVFHASVAHVRACWSDRVEMAAQVQAEMWAEGGYDRWAEGGWDVTGAYSFDPYDRAA